MDFIKNLLFSYKSTIFLLFTIGLGAAVATFVENDFGTSTARVLVYNATWYEIALILTTINLAGIIYITKMWRKPAKFIFHFAFVVILIGAGITRYVGFEGILHIREGETTNQMVSLEPYMQITINDGTNEYYEEYQKEFSALFNNFHYKIDFNNKTFELIYKNYQYIKQNGSDIGVIYADAKIGDEIQEVKLIGKRGMQGAHIDVNFSDGTVVHLEYGSKTLALPFSMKLREFELTRYPGSMSPSSFASEVTVIDGDKEIDYRIYMNNTLDYGGYKFFQSSYDMDELGTVLSVNNDPGKWPTYLGYFLLTVGLLWNLFDKNSRFLKLTRYLKKFKTVAIFVTALMFATSGEVQANDNVVNYLKTYKQDSLESAKIFGELVSQDHGGRMKPLNTMNTEIMYKLSGKSSMFGMNSDQIILGMLTRPDIWSQIKMIKITTPKLKEFLGVNKNENYIAFSEVFDGRTYRLTKLVEEANRVQPIDRGTYERDIIAVDERINIAYMVYNSSLLRILPYQNAENERWYSAIEALDVLSDPHREAVSLMIKGFINYAAEGQWQEANTFLGHISTYQQSVGQSVIPPKSKLDLEVFVNKAEIFQKLTLAYILVGFILFIVAMTSVINKKLYSEKVNKISYYTIAVLFLIHTIGMGLRWYISGHAPWSDTYESLLYIAWSAALAGAVFFRNSLMALAATAVVAAVFMFTAHLSNINPQITNLVPVLKSYWLTIHVSTITGSYGFLGLGAMLGFMALILFIFRNPNKPNIDETIKQITAISEIALIFGLSFLVIGNFLGGVWANESWGRYWGWDPKETWAYVAIVVYTIVLHLRLIKPLNTPFVFSVASLVAFSSILMTYFGVNFYLSGLHSYATGDPVPVPTWVYVSVITIAVLIALAYKNRNLKSSTEE
ncbi:cytochrome c biogenesis protein CcsA [Arcobacter sp. FWKO B]|uniref:cytochrome c biogenesis protein CcsA n=1 Tax=Arcobacter sp. FWKO B TaxID=2593672 RepID=UPI0018A45EAF|nr:cytochrome c biogenesis protein CcsA [Arcobacter sp. FWKO B]QOG11569.1 cytochrome C biogenesis protein [Arcobacter sp. FWKO B]